MCISDCTKVAIQSTYTSGYGYISRSTVSSTVTGYNTDVVYSVVDQRKLDRCIGCSECRPRLY